MTARCLAGARATLLLARSERGPYPGGVPPPPLVPLYLNYYLWLLGISVSVCALERFFSANPKQEFFRDGFGQDLFWLLFNVQYLSWMLAIVSVHVVAWINARVFEFGLPRLDEIGLIASWPLTLQFLVVFVLKDFLEWNIHRVLHRVPWLWEFHKLHHSIERLDWLTTFRSHWGEIVLYKCAIYLPLVILGADHRVIFAILIFGLVIQELAHANLRWDWGPLRYILNSPRLHAWHHAVEMHGADGQNFGVTLTVWDWLFGTLYFPGDQRRPSALGFEGLKQYPAGVWGRLWSPFTRRSRARKLRPGSAIAVTADPIQSVAGREAGCLRGDSQPEPTSSGVARSARTDQG